MNNLISNNIIVTSEPENQGDLKIKNDDIPGH